MPVDNTIQGGAMMGAVRQVQDLFSKVNKGDSKVPEMEKQEDEYTSKFTEEEVLKLTNAWQKDYETYETDICKQQDISVDYWLGKQKVDMVDQVEGKNSVVNKLFEAIETFLPIATRSNPEPLVSSDNSEMGQQLAKDVQKSLIHIADDQKLRRKLAKMTRHWLLYLLGAVEVDFDLEIDDIKTEVINPKRFIFDKDGYVDESGYFRGEYIGVKCKNSASRLASMFPEHKDYILSLAGKKKGTKLHYIKWWYKNTDVFFTMPGKVLGKFKNPHWNYEVEGAIDEMGNIIPGAEAINHLKKPQAPYVFLSIFSLGLKPHDETSLVLQNISQQDGINKRYRQLDKNIDSQNNGLVVDGRLMTNEQAAEAAGALRRGASIVVQGNPNEVIVQRQAPQLASDAWRSVEKSEENLANIFGTAGSTASGVESQETVRGKIMINQMDSSRIGGGVTEYIEQIADSIYNLWVQMMIVHYDTEHFVNMLGEDGEETKGIINTNFIKPLTVTVKEGSLVPKDPLTQRNEAVDLWSQGAIDPLNFYKKLDFPDPVSATQSLILWKMLDKGAITPEMYLPSFQIPSNPTNLANTMPGVGGPAVNEPTGTDIGQQNPEIGTQEAAGAKSQELLQAVPIK